MKILISPNWRNLEDGFHILKNLNYIYIFEQKNNIIVDLYNIFMIFLSFYFNFNRILKYPNKERNL